MSAPLRVTVIGGGTGSFQILAGLRDAERVDLRSIVTVADSGGDSGRMRKEFGVLPPGDVRRCLLALSEDATLLRDLFAFRFDEDPLADRQLGNLLFLALTKLLGTEREAINALHRLLKIRGRVIPVSWDDVHLCAELADGQRIEGESNIDMRRHDPQIPIARVFLAPDAQPNQEALDAIASSDVVLLAPGDLFTSTIPNLLVRGVPEALQRSAAPLIYVVNLMTKRGETDGFSASRHVAELLRYGGRVPDAVLVHAGHVSEEVALRYRAEDAAPVLVDPAELLAQGVREIRRAEIMSTASLARHDSSRTAGALLQLIDDLRGG